MPTHLTRYGAGVYGQRRSDGVEVVTINLAEGLIESGVCKTFAVAIECDCACTPPTMPTCRSEHLPTCPVAKAMGHG